MLDTSISDFYFCLKWLECSRWYSMLLNLARSRWTSWVDLEAEWPTVLVPDGVITVKIWNYHCAVRSQTTLLRFLIKNTKLIKENLEISTLFDGCLGSKAIRQKYEGFVISWIHLFFSKDRKWVQPGDAGVVLEKVRNMAKDPNGKTVLLTSPFLRLLQTRALAHRLESSSSLSFNWPAASSFLSLS